MAYNSHGESLILPNQLPREDGHQTTDAINMKNDKANKKQRIIEKYNLQDVEDIWATLLSEESSETDDDLFGLDDHLHDDDDDNSSGELWSEQTSETEDLQFERDTDFHEEPFSGEETGDEQISEETAPHSIEPEVCSAMLEHLGGMRQEAPRVKVFEPREDTLVIIDEETNDEQVVVFDQLACIRVSGLPAGISGKREKSGVKEIIETVDGNIYHELVPSEHELGDTLLCFSTEEQARFPVILFPKSNIKKRYRDKLLTDILLEKRFISKAILQKALQEFEQIKSATVEKIIAQKTRTPLAEIEATLAQAQQNQMLGLQTAEILLISGLFNEEEILDALEHFEYVQKIKIGEFLIDKGIVGEKEVYISLAEKHRMPFVDLTGRKFSRTSFAALPQSLIIHHEILPIAMKDDTLIVATYFVDVTHVSDVIGKIADAKHIKYVLSPPAQIRKIITLLFDKRK
ncbi:MAG: hypothetical protein M8357_04885 [Desulfobulbaceae bacterium]|nr:hypothetical protein [Desulfobulbaceae bacterium]